MVDVTIEALGQRGEGVATLDGARVYVPLALPGEIADISVEGERGTLERLVGGSADRGEPFCPYFGQCGGCQIQHLGEELYRQFKADLVASPLARLGITVPIDSMIPAHGEGRRRATLHARREGAGFMRLRSHEVYPIARCPILVGQLAPAADLARAVFAALGEADVAMTATLGGIDVAVRAEKARAKPHRLAPLVAQFRLSRLALNGEVVLQTTQPRVRIGPAEVDLPVGSFLQATELAEETLAGLVLEGLGKAKNVADLFCGLGPFTLRLAERARVTAHDSDKAVVGALDKAVRNTRGLKPVLAKARDLFREPLTRFELESYDAVVMDPPRAGAEAQTRELAQSVVKTVVYVSCDPKTFARDAAILLGGGYTLRRVTPVDQFAWSTHIEMVGVFAR